MGKDKLKNVWSTIKTTVQNNVASEIKVINKEVASRANKAPWYKKPTSSDLKLAYKTNAKNSK
jgi:hypothetical protein